MKPGTNVRIILFAPYVSDDSWNPVLGSSGLPTYSDTRVAVVFEEPFTLRAGLKSDVNSARVPCTEFDKLGTNPGQTGALLFYFDTDPTPGQTDDGFPTNPPPDMAVEWQTIIEAEPADVGILYGQTTAQVIEWQVFFSDFRLAFVYPRGGRLKWGPLNQTVGQPGDSGSNAGSGQGSGVTADPPLPNSDLIQKCLDAMGASDFTVVDPGVDDAAPVLNLNWAGNHAPAELQKILELIQGVFCLHLDGSASIELIGQGTIPTVPAGQLIATLPIPTIDVRPLTVGITSYPHAVLSTETISGDLGDDGQFEFVVQDTDDSWQPVFGNTPPKIFCGCDPVELIQQNFAQLSLQANNGSAAAALGLDRLPWQLFFCIRLDPDAYPPQLCPILTRRYEADGTQGFPIIKATISIVSPDGTTIGQTFTDADCGFFQVCDGSVIIAHQRLGTINSPVPSPTFTGNFFQPVDSVSVRLTHELIQPDDSGTPKPVYYESAWQRIAGQPQQIMDPDTIANVFENSDPSVFVVPHPELLLLQVDGDDSQFRKPLDAAAKAIAAVALRNADNRTQEIRAVGFFAADLSGAVSQIEIDQRECFTKLKVNNWYWPLSSFVYDNTQPNGPPGREAYPRQADAADLRRSIGMSGSQTPVLTAGPSPLTGRGGDLVTVKVTQQGGSNGTASTPASWTYSVTSWDGDTIYAPTGSPVAPKMQRNNGTKTPGTIGSWSVWQSLLISVDEVAPTVTGCTT